MKFFLVFVAAVALLASAEAAKKKKKAPKVPKVTIHKIPCGEESFSYPITQKGDFVAYAAGVTESGTKAPIGYALLQRNGELGNTYLESNFFTEFSDDGVNCTRVVTITCAEVLALAEEFGTFNASAILDEPLVTYQQLVSGTPYTTPVEADTANQIKAFIPQTDIVPRTGTSDGEFGIDATAHKYIARASAAAVVAESETGFIVACAPLNTVECAEPKAKPEKKKEETTTKKQAS